MGVDPPSSDRDGGFSVFDHSYPGYSLSDIRSRCLQPCYVYLSSSLFSPNGSSPLWNGSLSWIKRDSNYSDWFLEAGASVSQTTVLRCDGTLCDWVDLGVVLYDKTIVLDFLCVSVPLWQENKIINEGSLNFWVGKLFPSPCGRGLGGGGIQRRLNLL